MSIKQVWISIVHQLQDSICAAVEKLDGKAIFKEDKWERAEGGGGTTRVIADGNVFEKGGVNTSVVYGDVTDLMRTQLKIGGAKWFACGISIVLHPFNPFVPTVHCNYRMFELYGAEGTLIDRWFGGGTDLTPFYPTFKKNCDEYFVNSHRNNERRGIGGIFYDYQKPAADKDVNFWMNFGKECGETFTNAYIPIAAKRKDIFYSEQHKHWQEIRRGRYVEFNLVHDRGTIFGLKTNGRIESILMSLPPTVRFEYDFKPTAGSEEDKLLQACLHPIDWLGIDISEEEKTEWARKSNSC